MIKHALKLPAIHNEDKRNHYLKQNYSLISVKGLNPCLTHSLPKSYKEMGLCKN